MLGPLDTDFPWFVIFMLQYHFWIGLFGLAFILFYWGYLVRSWGNTLPRGFKRVPWALLGLALAGCSPLYAALMLLQ